MKLFSGLLILQALVLFQSGHSQNIQSPDKMFGFRMGSDRKLINWEQMLAYFSYLDKQSNRIRVIELGKTTLNRPMIMVIISSSTTLANLEKYKNIQQKLANPYSLDQSAADALIHEGKLVFLIAMNIHSTEIASSQESVELAYELAITSDKKIQKILDNIIILLLPSLNPDGLDMVTKWYLDDVGNEYEGSRMPMKYHYYADHDNNRDWFFFNLIESCHVARILYHEWYPEIILDQHQMGSTHARLFLPPYADPINQNIDPLIIANVNMIGNHVVADMYAQGFKGIVTGAIYNAFFEGTMSKTPLWHNRIGILMEAAGVQIASPVFFPKTSLQGMGPNLPEYKQQNNFLAPWEGGWWRLRDIIDMEKAATYSMLNLAVTYKEKFKNIFFRLNKAAIETGKVTPPFAYAVPPEQHDPNSAIELLKRLRIANIKIYKTADDFLMSQKIIKKGTFIIPLAQPSRAYIKDLLENQQYPNLREYSQGPPRKPYDVTAWTLPLQMGVEVFEINELYAVNLEPVTLPALDFEYAYYDSGWVAIERRFLNSFKAINYLLKSEIPVFQTDKEVPGFEKGTFLLSVSDLDSTQTQNAFIANELLIHKIEIPVEEIPKVELTRAQIAIYQPWIASAYDEGWLRLILDEFGFEYIILSNSDFKSRVKFITKFDVLIFGSQNTDSIVEGIEQNAEDEESNIDETTNIRKEYSGGISEIGVEKTRQFLLDGGKVLFFGEACNFAIDELLLPAQNILKDIDHHDYYAPGSIFLLNLNKDSNLTYGMQNRVSVFKNLAIALELKPYHMEIKESGYFGSSNVLQSGWAIGEENLYDKVALAEIPVGQGLAILYAFRPQHRGQTYSTFKLIFNALYK